MKPRLTNDEKTIIFLIKNKSKFKKLNELLGIFFAFGYIPKNKNDMKVFSEAFGFIALYGVLVVKNLKGLKKLEKKLEKRKDLDNLNLIKKEIEEIEKSNVKA
jgi:hypothetical protein